MFWMIVENKGEEWAVPWYIYRCPNHGEFEIKKSMDDDRPVVCPKRTIERAELVLCERVYAAIPFAMKAGE